ncbi:MAG: hypothetical protein K2O18_16180 [Oscillospiraceae bacterium]|nr:hypothetical protein [Oscillospiraceae bacterium]
MKPCRNCPGAGQTGQSVHAAGTAQDTAMNRYSHPIITRNNPASGSAVELLADILETLSHHSEVLEELLRRTEKPDTM